MRRIPPFKMTAFISALISVLLVVCLAPTAYGAPAGAVKLSSARLSNRGSFYCGYVKGRWIPGRLLSHSWFYPIAAERRNLLSAASRATGQKRKRLQRKAKELLAMLRVQAPLCVQSVSTPTPVSSPTLPPENSTPVPMPTEVATGTPTPTAIPALTNTPIATATPAGVVLHTVDSSLLYTEHALFIIPPAGQVTWTGENSWSSVYSTANINSYVNRLKTAFPADYFFVVVTATDLLPDNVPNVSTYRRIANGIGQDSITGVGVPNICRYHTSGAVINGVYAVLDHEIGHNWGVFLGAEMGSGHWLWNSTASGQMAATYSDDGHVNVKQITGDPLHGFYWASLDNLVRNETEVFSEQDLYVQGLSATFPEVYVLNSPVYNPDHTVSYASYSTYDKAWVESRNGVRSPNYQTSEKRFRMGVVYVARDMAEVLRVYQPIERSISHFVNGETTDNTNFHFQIPFLVETHYRGSVDARLADLDGNTRPALSIVGGSHFNSSDGAAIVQFAASDPDGPAPAVSCVPASVNCSINGTNVLVSGLPAGAHFFTIKAQDAGGKKAFAHFVIDVS